MAKRRYEINYEYTPFCDENVVKALIEQRYTMQSDIDKGFINENVLLTYIDLDRLIEKAELSVGQRKTLDLIMQGYAMADIAESLGGERQKYNVFYRRAIKKICDAAVNEWAAFYGDRPAKGVCYPETSP